MAMRCVDRVAAAVGAAGVGAHVFIPGSNLYYTLSIKQRLTERPNVYIPFPDRTIAAFLPILSGHSGHYLRSDSAAVEASSAGAVLDVETDH
jgi:hypothetical protein